MIKYNQDMRRESFDYSIKLPKKPTVYAVGFFISYIKLLYY